MSKDKYLSIFLRQMEAIVFNCSGKKFVGGGVVLMADTYLSVQADIYYPDY